MADHTSIEWTDATWNPVTGCSTVSPGCDNCYAIRVSHRLAANPNVKIRARHEDLTDEDEHGELDWTGEVRLNEDMLDRPLHWKRPRRIFVNSLSDLFHPGLSDEAIARVFAVMALAPQHTFQVLTKRPQRMAEWFGDPFWLVRVIEHAEEMWGRLSSSAKFAAGGWWADGAWPLPNVWLGTSIESDRYAFRADHLRRTPAAVRFVSAEPLLGPLPSLNLDGIDWLIVGGESGPAARPMHPDWVRDLRDRCHAPVTVGDEFHPLGSTLFFFKQWGDWLGFSPDAYGESITLAATTGAVHKDWPGDRMSASVRVGKKAAGRLLGGRTWDEVPASRHEATAVSQ